MLCESLQRARKQCFNNGETSCCKDKISMKIFVVSLTLSFLARSFKRKSYMVMKSCRPVQYAFVVCNIGYTD